MKLHAASDPVDRYGAPIREKSFSIKATSKAFDILVSKIYKDKTTAIIRELSCNAYDAHVQAGKKTVPFDVCLPSDFEPHFRVRDYGPGLTYQQVEDVYTTFFESTKEDSNDYIGALGLGCKSPFALVDSFVVNSYQNGTVHSFTMFKEHGEPKVRASSAEPVPSDEPDGLEVVVPIPKQYWHDFRNRAPEVFQWFPVLPNGVEVNRLKSVAEHKVRGKLKWQMMDSHVRSSTCAVMGNVLYPIQMGLLDLNASYNNTLIVYFDLGELDVQAGREELSYDEITINALKTRIAEIKDQAAKLVNAYYGKAKTLFDAYLLFEKAPETIKALYPLASPSFNGAALNRSGIGGIFQNNCYARYQDLRDQSQRMKDHVVIPDKKPPVFLFVDTITMNDQRATLWRAKHRGRTGYIVYGSGRTHSNRTSSDVRPEDIAHYSAMLAGQDISLTSQFKVRRDRAKVRMVARPLSSSSSLGMDHRHEVEIDLDEENGFYLPLKSNKFLSPNTDNDADYETIFALVKLYESFSNKKLVLVPYTRQRPFDNHDNWQHLYVAVYEQLKDKIKDREFVRTLSLAENYSRLSAHLKANTFDKNRFGRIAAGCEERHPVQRFFAFYEECEKAWFTHRFWITFLSFIGRRTRPTPRLAQMFNAMNQQYPLVYAMHRQCDYGLLPELAVYATVKLHELEQSARVTPIQLGIAA